MQNEEKLLSIDDAYDVVADYLENLYIKTKSEDIVDLLSDMQLLQDGKTADPAIQSDWNKAVDKLLTQNTNLREKFELAGKKLNIQQAFQLMIIFLETYNYFDEIVDLVNKMKLVENNMARDSELWAAWTESVNKILSQNPRERPLFIFLGTKILTIDDAFDTMIDWLNKYYNRIKAEDVKMLLDKRHNKYKYLNIWNQAVNSVLKNEPIENGLSAEEAYETAAIFLAKYNQDINSNEITKLISGMKLLNKLESTDPVVWRSWSESINKTLNKYRTF